MNCKLRFSRIMASFFGTGMISFSVVVRLIWLLSLHSHGSFRSIMKPNSIACPTASFLDNSIALKISSTLGSTIVSILSGLLLEARGNLKFGVLMLISFRCDYVPHYFQKFLRTITMPNVAFQWWCFCRITNPHDRWEILSIHWVQDCVC